MFKVGDKIVYPMHGAGTIESIEEKEILGEKQKYYIMKMPVGDIKVMVPTKNAELIGVRDVIGNDVAQDVLEVLGAAPTDMSSNWSKRYRDNQDKMKSGDICEVADVVRNLAFRAKVKPLATGEKKMLTNAKQILVSELVLAEAMDKDQVESLIDERIDKDYTEYNNIIKNLKGQINDLTSDNYTLKQEIRALKEKLETQEDSSNKQVTNIDLLKRISNLEKIVYGRNE